MMPEKTFGEEARVALWVNDEEADALMSVLLHVADLPHISGEIAERLLMRVSEVQRELARAEILGTAKHEAPCSAV